RRAQQPGRGVPPGAAIVARRSLFKLRFLVLNVLASDRIKLFDQHLLGHVAFVLGRGVEMTRAGGRFQLDLFANTFCHDELLLWTAGAYATSPRARRSARTTSMPTLSMVRRAWVDTRRRTQRFSLSTQKRRDCRLGRKRRLVLLLACETWLPTIGPLPVTWHTRAMVHPLLKSV